MRSPTAQRASAVPADAAAADAADAADTVDGADDAPERARANRTRSVTCGVSSPAVADDVLRVVS
ncbi:hypothetical protein [Cellulosimicrobium funkei]|uniref:Uncharacterized protein n=1 Tax=Cellulosimicrobium cellulans TaxID=1710 RepID=A0AAV5PBT6_CELCE|nr:hypothetical protein Ccel01_33420 [Cellulosimicrobium cellulans]